MKKTSISIIQKLQQSGYQAYWVGGCVRDILMGKEPKDFDIVTSAKPEEMEKILQGFAVIPVGKQFGVMMAVKNGHHFEIATFRSEKEYTDARRPDKVFWTSAQNDAQRRDFTVNGLFLDPLIKEKIEDWKLPGIRQMKTTKQGLVIDYVGGIKDLEEKTLRFIGDADKRIQEDHLRLLRAVRFKNKLGFKYGEKALQAIRNNASRIKIVSSERTRDELNKIFSSPKRTEGLEDLDKTGLLKEVLPEIARLKGLPQPDVFHKEGDVFKHTLLTLKALPPKTPITLVWAALLHDAGKADTISFPKTKTDRIRFNKHVKYSAGIAAKICRRLKFPNYERELIVWLVKNHMMLGDIPKMKLAKQRRWLMNRRFPWLMHLHKADALGSEPRNLALYEKNLQMYEKAKKMLAEEKKRPKFKPLLNGHDLIREFKLDSGPQIGQLLKLVEDAQLEGRLKNKSDAINFLKKLKK